MPQIDDDTALSTEAEAQSQQTLMPWIWGALGLIVIAIFVAWLVFGARGHMRQPPAAAPPTIKPAAQGY